MERLRDALAARDDLRADGLAIMRGKVDLGRGEATGLLLADGHIDDEQIPLDAGVGPALPAKFLSLSSAYDRRYNAAVARHDEVTAVIRENAGRRGIVDERERDGQPFAVQPRNESRRDDLRHGT